MYRHLHSLKPVLLGLIIILIVLGMSNCSDSSTQLASFDGGVVHEDEFLNHYQKYLSVTGLKDNLSDRKKILRSVLHEKLILKNWQENALDDHAEVKEILRRQEEQALLDALWQEKMSHNSQPDPKVLASMLVLERTRFHIQEAQYPDLASALRASENWVNSQAPIDYKDLGFLLLEDVHPRLMKKIGKMKVGEISNPIRMGQGYILLKLVKKQISPFIRPREFAAARERLQQEWTVNQSDSILDAYAQDIVSDLDVKFSAEGSSVLLSLLANASKSTLRARLAESSQSNLVLCTTRNGDWSLEMIIPHLLDTREEHLDAIIDQMDVQKLLSGILVRRTLLAKAREAGLDKRKLTQEAIHKRQDLWRIKTWQERFADTVSIHEDYIAKLNQDTIDNNSKIFHRNVELLVFNDTLSARDAYKKLHTNTSGVKVKSDWVSNLELPADGKMGWVTAEDLGYAAKLVFGQELNTWTKPWSYAGEVFLFRSIAEKSDDVDVNLVNENLELQIREQGALAQLEQALIAMENNSHAKIYEERVKSIPYIQLSGRVDEG